jgi:hypothetical protein
MKKLLVLALVLSMASLASAALTLSISGPDSLMVGTQGTYTISYTGGTILASDVDITADIGTIGGGVIITTNRDEALDLVRVNPLSGYYQIAITNDLVGTDLGSPTASFVFTAPGTTGTAHLALSDNGQIDLDWVVLGNAVMGGKSVTITPTPEPMTLALLGLGGLFIRRRSA